MLYTCLRTSPSERPARTINRRAKRAGHKTAASGYVSTEAIRAAKSQLESVHQDRLRLWPAANLHSAVSDKSIKTACNQAAYVGAKAAHAPHATKAKFTEPTHNAASTADAYYFKYKLTCGKPHPKAVLPSTGTPTFHNVAPPVNDP